MVEKVPRSRRYQLVGKGYSICVVFLKLFEKVYAPLTAGLLAPFRGDHILAEDKRCQLDRLYQHICEVSMRSCGLLESRLLLDFKQREQNSRWGPYNGN